ncbi:MAG TPA: uroporphyrinogen decarboxylase family protein [Dongiaceae bacterium]|nr:uroporphyrinogen decarboxylase family protein [Dongiaceae bacterium]
MNSLERIMAAVRFEHSDRVPVVAQVFGHAAVLADVPLERYVRDGELLARCQLQALARYGYDAVFALMDASVETEALGSRLNYRSDIYPYIERYALDDAANIGALSVPDPRVQGRMPELLKAARILRREVGDEVLVVGCVLGPMTLAMQLLGAEKTLFLAIDNPDLFARVLDFAVEIEISFGLAQIEAGAHLPMVFDPSASPAVIPPQFFREFELPRLKRLFSVFKSAGAAASWLHIAGPADAIFPYYPEAGVEIANFDYCVDPLRASRILPRTCLDGNIKPISFVDDAPEDIAAESSRVLRLFKGRNGLILSSGCEIPPESSPDNVAAMIATSRLESQ